MNNDKIILSVATTGSWPSKLQNPGLPVTPEEIAQAAVESWREGAAVVHVHVRDEAGKMTCDLSRFQRVKQLIRLIDSIPAGSLWSVCAVGWRQLPMNMLAIAMGGHARTGLEDNLYYKRGELAKSNAQLVARLARIARECGREPATPAEAREMLGLVEIGIGKGSRSRKQRKDG